MVEPSRFQGLLTISSLGLAGGCLAGFLRATRSIALNQYSELGLHRLRALTLVDEVTWWSGLGLLLAVAGYVTLRAGAWLLRVWFREAAELRVLHAGRYHRRLSLLAALGVVLVAGWLANVYLLPYRFAPVSLAADVAITVVVLGLERLVQLPAVRKAVRRSADLSRWLAVAAVAGLFLANVGVVVSRKLLDTPPLNVLLISVDTLRYDALGIDGCEIPEISPNIDRLARRSIIFRNAVSQSPWTLP